MFEQFSDALSDSLNDAKIQLYESTHPVNNISEDDFDSEFYDWTQISATYYTADGYQYNYK